MSMWNPNNGTSLHPATSSLALGMPLQLAMSRHATLRHNVLLHDLTPRLYHDYQRPSTTTSTNRSQTLLHFHP
jgi:hypothetical protein